MDSSVSIVRKRVGWDMFADALQIGKRVCLEAQFTTHISASVKDKPNPNPYVSNRSSTW